MVIIKIESHLCNATSQYVTDFNRDETKKMLHFDIENWWIQKNAFLAMNNPTGSATLCPFIRFSWAKSSIFFKF